MEGTKVKVIKQYHGCADGTKSDKDVTYRLLIALMISTNHKPCKQKSTKTQNILRYSTHRRCLRAYHSSVFNNPPFTPSLLCDITSKY